jgi:hypothetical protein
MTQVFPSSVDITEKRKGKTEKFSLCLGTRLWRYMSPRFSLNVVTQRKSLALLGIKPCSSSQSLYWLIDSWLWQLFYKHRNSMLWNPEVNDCFDRSQPLKLILKVLRLQIEETVSRYGVAMNIFNKQLWTGKKVCNNLYTLIKKVDNAVVQCDITSQFPSNE